MINERFLRVTSGKCGNDTTSISRDCPLLVHMIPAAKLPFTHPNPWINPAWCKATRKPQDRGGNNHRTAVPPKRVTKSINKKRYGELPSERTASPNMGDRGHPSWGWIGILATIDWSGSISHKERSSRGILLSLLDPLETVHCARFVVRRSVLDYFSNRAQAVD